MLAVLGKSETIGQELRLPSQLPWPLYVRANKVIEAAGGRWDRRQGAHLFESDAYDRIDQILLTGEVTAPRDFGFFPTPANVVARLIELAALEPDHVVLEPSAGRGAIAVELAKVCATVDCIELLPENVAALEAARLASVRTADFLGVAPVPAYDRVVMNPPFARQSDIAHVTHALRFLRPSGRLVAVMSGGVTFRQSTAAQAFRELIVRRGSTSEALPSGSFRSSGTDVEAVIVVIPGQP